MEAAGAAFLTSQTFKVWEKQCLPQDAAAVTALRRTQASLTEYTHRGEADEWLHSQSLCCEDPKTCSACLESHFET